MQKRRFLVMARVGDKSLHAKWLQGAERKFDLYLSYYGSQPGRYREQADHWRERGETKWPALHAHLEEDRELLSGYEAIWMPDDDLLVDAAGINRMFEVFATFELSLAQPALSMDSHFSHSALLHAPGYVLRYANFVEVMAPVFSRPALNLLKPSFAQSKIGWGLDHLWIQLLERAGMGDRIAIIDAVQVVHTRPIGGGDIYGASQGVTAREDAAALQRLYPELNLDTRSRRADFEMRGGVREHRRHGLSARWAGWLHRRLAKLRARSTPKHRRTD